MSKVMLVAERQFRQEVFKRGFLITLLSLPLFIGLSVGLGMLTSTLNETTTTVGYVDEAGLLAELPEPPEGVRLVAFSTVDQAEQALAAGEIDSTYRIPSNYFQTRQAELIYTSEIPSDARDFFDDTVRLNLLAGQSPEVVRQVVDGPQITVRIAGSGREVLADSPTVSVFMPLIFAVLFAFLVMTISSTLMLAVVEEKENRTIEVVVTSIRPGHMMAGKVMGIVAMGLLLLLAWVLVFVVAAWLGGNLLDIAWLQDVDVHWQDLAMLAVAALPSLLFIAAFMVLLGSSIIENQEAQQVGPFMFIALLVPIYLLIPLSQDPNGPLAIAFTLFPVTSVMTIAIRSVFSSVPAGQVWASGLVGLVCALITIWLAGKAFRLSMLRYGQRLNLRELVLP